MTRVRTENGVVEGAESDGLHHFRNIPYAAAPFGANRFRPPRRAADWDGVRDAITPGPAVPQPPEDNPLGALYSATDTGEDCLTLEVWTPDPGRAGLPVMVHLHGGGYVYGAGSLPGYSGRNFARDGVVHVGINYRLGVEGFLYLGEGHDNLGLRDQCAALAWVQRNIAAFGGDPARVTIFGQSGGGVSVMFQTALPASRGAFCGAIAQSGCSLASVDADEASRITRQVARGLGVAPTVEGLSSVGPQRTAAASYKALARFALGLARGDRRALLLSPFRGVHGTRFLPANPVESAGRTPGVPLLAGTVRNETGPLLDGIMSVAGPVAPLVRLGLRRALRLDRSTLRAYREGPRRIRGLAALVEAGWSDWGFRIPTIRLLEARPEPSWLYEFRWQSEQLPPDSGSFHAIDLPFVRDDLETVMAQGQPALDLFGNRPPEELAQRMHADFVRFAATGDPGWQRYDRSDRATMVYDTGSRCLQDAAGAERAAWDGRRPGRM
ncbi:carboxylesterase/lipase family protein [Streptomyces sp. SID14478]|uniref:carboxylesterase family protein n=1 Tax=Streptomyces sp. SID14478 TaxID=2706073 RepID=UPI0013DF498E|nr:carboxylesterase/lipase family protein [Streptomyces sp. SID14478]